MDQNPLLSEFLELAKKLGVRVRIEKLLGGARSGGLIRLRGTPTLLVDSRCSAPEKIATLARTLASFELGDVQLSEAAAQLLRRRPSPEPSMRQRVKSLLRPKPGLRRTSPPDVGDDEQAQLASDPKANDPWDPLKHREPE